MADRIILTIGTKKGVFVADAAKPRRSFALRGPFGPGVPVYSTLIDTRGTPRLYASAGRETGRLPVGSDRSKNGNRSRPRCVATSGRLEPGRRDPVCQWERGSDASSGGER